MPKAARTQGRRGAPALEASVAQLRALAHPLRLRLVELFAETPRTTMQVARLLGQPPTRLYHHVNALERAGVLRVGETRRVRGTTERWYEVATPLTYKRSRAQLARSPGEPKSLTTAVMAMLEHARREVAAALADPKPRHLVALRMLTVGSRREVAAAHRRLRAFIRGEAKRAKHASPRRRTAVERWAATITFAPVWPRGPGE